MSKTKVERRLPSPTSGYTPRPRPGFDHLPWLATAETSPQPFPITSSNRKANAGELQKNYFPVPRESVTQPGRSSWPKTKKKKWNQHRKAKVETQQ